MGERRESDATPTKNRTAVDRKSEREGKKSAQGKTPAKLLVAMTGKASAAKTATGAGPVFAYIASLPQPQRGIAERIDALAAKSLPDIQRAVKWGMAYYGVDGGWCFSSGAFVGHVKLMFIRGTEIRPEPPVTPIGMGKSTRGVELASVDDFDERQGQRDRGVASVAMPFIRGRVSKHRKLALAHVIQLFAAKWRKMRRESRFGGCGLEPVDLTRAEGESG